MKTMFPYRYRVLIMLFFLILITYLDRICISLVGVRIKNEFHLTNTQFGFVLGAFALAYALFEIPAGVLGDKIGQKKVFVRIVIWWSVFTALTGLVTGFVTLLITRFLFGMGEAGAFPNGCAAISRWFPAGETSKGTSCLLIGSSSGAAVAPLIVVSIASAYGWRAPFFVNGMIGLIWVLICLAWFQNEPHEMKHISIEERALIENGRRFIPHDQNFPWHSAIKSRTLWAMALAAFCSQWALYFFVAWMPLYLQEGRHFSESEMAFVTSYLFVIGIVSGLAGGIYIDSFVRRRGLKKGRRTISMSAFGMMSILFITTAITPNNIVASVCLMACYSLVPVNAINYFSACVDIGGSKAGTVTGIVNFSGCMGAFVLSILFGKIADITHNYNVPLLIVAAVLFLGCLLWLLIDPTRELSSEEIPVPSRSLLPV